MEGLRAPVERLMGGQSQEADDEEEDLTPVDLALTRDQQCAREIRESDGAMREVSSDFSNIIYQLQKHLLPSLKKGVWRLCYLVFGPDHLEKNEPPEFQAALEVLKELKTILDQIKHQTKSLWKPSHSVSGYPHWRFYVNYHRCSLVDSKMENITEMLGRLFEKYDRLFFISEMRIVNKLDAGIAWRSLIRHTRRVSGYLDSVINWFALSDLGVVQDQWQLMAEEVGDILQRAVEFPIKNPGIPHRELFCDLIPLIKLFRIFFKKLSRATPSEPHFIYQMSLDQLSSLIDSTLFFPDVLEEFIAGVRSPPDPADEFDEEPTFLLMDHFERTMRILHPFLDPNGYDKAIRHEFSKWYMSWRQLFYLAIDRFTATYFRLYSDLSRYHQW
ncbi:hypothetical protein VP01_4539g1 [Puccinia sorghi]|uniref:Uncharacterized protein n=1 Tax=Puccinia sorghi TaxID=27349 RepID=A0A0L6UNX9_9BASI|nr:hypothetical protein VP01_4539g1 [Puccinia sorghi]